MKDLGLNNNLAFTIDGMIVYVSENKKIISVGENTKKEN
jgi:hypothetical protein